MSRPINWHAVGEDIGRSIEAWGTRLASRIEAATPAVTQAAARAGQAVADTPAGDAVRAHYAAKNGTCTGCGAPLDDVEGIVESREAFATRFRRLHPNEPRGAIDSSYDEMLSALRRQRICGNCHASAVARQAFGEGGDA